MSLPDADDPIIEHGRTMVHDEARALDALAESLGAEFETACRLILDANGKLIVAGLGKSGHIGRKIAATFASTGTTATFLHLAEAIHGDLGIADRGDVALLISQSGQTAELQPVIDHLDALHVPIIAITGHAGSMLGAAAAAALVLPHWPEVGPEAVAPTTSTTMTLALGDALAMTVMREKGFTRTDFGRIHPGGTLGLRLRPVKRVMHGGDQLPLVSADTSMHDAIVVMSEKRLGVVGVTDADGRLVGVITDGDLRRNIERGLDHLASAYMNASPKAVAPDALVDEALTLFEEHRITTLFVVEDGIPVGVVHIHDTPAAR